MSHHPRIRVSRVPEFPPFPRPTRILLLLLTLLMATVGSFAVEAQVQERPGAPTHSLAGRESCLACHAPGIAPVVDAPPDHEGRQNLTCLWCHAPDSPMLSVEPSRTPHPNATSAMNCMFCHGPEVEEAALRVPSSHEGRENRTCLWCHLKVEGISGKPAGHDGYWKEIKDSNPYTTPA